MSTAFESAREPLVEALAAAACQSMAEQIERTYFTMLALGYEPTPALKPSIWKRMSWKLWAFRRWLALKADPTLLEELDHEELDHED
jgi:hypothetical protein